MFTFDLSQAGSRPPELLVVDSDLGHAQLVHDAAQQLGLPWNVTHSATGSDALDRIERPGHSFDLAVVELNLPDIGGLDIVRAWRRRFTNEPLLVMSSIAAERTLLEAIRAGTNGYMLKDGNVHTIAQCMGQVLRGHHPISPELTRYLLRLAGAPRQNPYSTIQLTAKEKETLRQIGRGHSYAQIATLMGVSMSTIQTHVRSLYRKLGAHSKMQAVLKAKDHGLI